MKLPQYDNETIKKIKESRDYASICFLTCGVSEVLLESLQSIVDNTTFPYEMFIMAQGVSQETSKKINETLNGFLKKPCIGIKCLTFPYNEGFIVGMNEALRLSTGRWIIVYSDDIIVPKGWLEALIDKAKSNKKIGIVGFKEACRPSDLIQKQNDVWKVDNYMMVSMICSLITRECYQRTGGFDYRYGDGICEDDDYCLMARINGFELASVDVPIKHVHSSSWRRLLTYEERMKRVAINKDIFNNKWKHFNIVRV